jgi:hypothetical protein
MRDGPNKPQFLAYMLGSADDIQIFHRKSGSLACLSGEGKLITARDSARVWHWLRIPTVAPRVLH